MADGGMTMSSGGAEGRTSAAPSSEASVPAASPASLCAAVAAAVREPGPAPRGWTPVWLGAEPTFTDRYSESREWLCEALGADKEARARKLLTRLLERHPGAAVLRPLG